MHLFSSSEAYMTNHTSHFKQLELSLAINHLDTCYCAHNRAAFRREEGEGTLRAIQSTFWSTQYCETNSGTGTRCIVVQCVVCFCDLNKTKKSNRKQQRVLYSL